MTVQAHPDGRQELELYVHLVAALGHARGRFGSLTRRATLAEIAGRVGEAVQLSAEALALGSRSESRTRPVATPPCGRRSWRSAAPSW